MGFEQLIVERNRRQENYIAELEAFQERMLQRTRDLEMALRALIDIDPLVPSEVDSSLSCNYCCEYQPGDGRDRHRDTCPWVRAVKLLGEPR